MEAAMRAAILGTGSMGRRHTLTLKELGVPVTAVCNINRKKAETFVEETGIQGASIYHNFEDMLEKANFDMLFICLPPFANERQFERAADKGKHIFIEKPIALKTSIGADMVRSARKNGITTMVGFHMRKGDAVKRIAELVQKGEAGKAVLFNAQYQCNSLHTPWWTNVDLCGGQIFEQAIHIYDLCRYFFGDPKFVEGIMANICHSHLPNYTVEDVSACIAGFTTGALASITANNCAIPGKWIGKVTAVFEKLTVELSDHNHATITFTSGGDAKTEVINGEANAFLDEVKEFVDCANNGKQTSCDILEGFKSLCFVETVVNSAKLDGAKFAYDAKY
jgi:predicted dehydrogenase